MITYIKPIIEHYAYSLMDARRVWDADFICRYINSLSIANHMLSDRQDCKIEFYRCISDLLESSYYHRVLLYLPFGILQDAPDNFKKVYMGAWRNLLQIYDVRENFHIGDVFEVDARPIEGLDLVVKCAHLTPWLLKFGYLDFFGLRKILNEFRDDEILLRSFSDTWRYIKDKEILSKEKISLLADATSKISKRKKLQPTYISKERLKWIEECKDESSKRLLTPKAHLEGPFSPNLRLTDIPKIEKGKVIFIGGSRLKGYGISNSDLDIYELDSLYKTPELRPGSPHAAHIYFNCVCAGNVGSAEVLENISKAIMELYAKDQLSKVQSVERLELDLLQYRLLHKGFQRFVGKTKFATGNYIEMDGDCPFYDDGYRKIATMLYAKYVYIP